MKERSRKLRKEHVRKDVRKYFYSKRTVDKWNMINDETARQGVYISLESCIAVKRV